MILEAKDLTFFYPGGKRPVLEGIQLQIASGERVGLFGPSGRGKTTLCKLLAGYDVPKRGQVLLDGSPLKKYPNPCPVQMIWQHPETVVDPLLPLGVSLGEGGQPDPALLEALHIRKGWLSRYPGELSGGELQRFCLARALHSGVKFLLCDEMTAMLDLVTQAQIWEFLLKEGERRNLGFLIISHQEALLHRVCTRIETLPTE